ncbi:MAG: glycosyltransferase family 39 protein [Bacteroidota bacterium]
MNAPVEGYLALVSFVLLSLLAFSAYRKGNTKIALGAILVLGLILRIFIASDGYLHEWDERYHALVAKNMMENPFKPMLYTDPVLDYDYRHWTANHVWVHKQPFPLWCMAISMATFGVDEFTLRLPSILISLLAVWATYLIGFHLFGRRVGVLAAFLHAIHGLTLELVGGRVATDHFDVFFQALIEFSVLAAVLHLKLKKVGYLLLMGLFCGLAILTKWLPALIVFPIYCLLYLHYEKRIDSTLFKNVILALLVTVLIAIPWQLWIHTQFPLEAAWESEYNYRHLGEALEGHERPVLIHFEDMRMIFGELVYLPLLFFLYKGVRRKNWKLLSLVVWVFVPYVFFTLVQTKMKAYTLFTSPSIFILTAFLVVFLLHKKVRMQGWRLYLGLITVALLVILPVRYSFERMKLFAPRHENSEEISLLQEELNRLPAEDSILIFGSRRPIELMFYANRNLMAYEDIPTDQEVTDLISRGWMVYYQDEEYGFRAARAN